MKKNLLATIICITLAFTAYSQDYKVVGYIPTYSSLFSNQTLIPFSKITHINVAFLNPSDATGDNFDFPYTSQLTTLVSKSHENYVKVSISLAGAMSSSSSYYTNLNTIISNNTLRAKFEDRLVKFVSDNQLDGLDIDIETDLLSTLCQNGNTSNYSKFISGLKAKLPTGKTLTVALGTGYYADFVPDATLKTFDWINVMSYDEYGTWTTIGQHASFSKFTGDEEYYLSSRGIDYGNIVMGVPFYGYGWAPSKNNVASSYKFLVNLNSATISPDYYKNPSTNYEYYYNGKTTMQKKAQEVYDQGMAGIMIWELGQDAPAPNSLLDVIHTVIPLSANDELLKTSSIIVYPNPAQTRLFIEGKEAGSYVINNIEGQQVLSGKLTDDFTKEIPLDNFQSGVYIFKFSSNRETIIKKIIIE